MKSCPGDAHTLMETIANKYLINEVALFLCIDNKTKEDSRGLSRGGVSATDVLS